MKNSYILLNWIKRIIDKECNNSIKRKDQIALLGYIWISILFLAILANILPIFIEVLEILNIPFEAGLDINQIIGTLFEKAPKHIFNVKNDFIFLSKIFISITLDIIVILILRRTNIRRNMIVLIAVIIQAASLCLFFPQIIKSLILMIIIVLTMTIFYPVGSGFYYKVFAYITYIGGIIEPVEKNFEKNMKNAIIYGFLFVFLMKYNFSILSIGNIIILYVAILLLLGVNSNDGIIRNNIKKIMLYSLFVPIVLLNTNNFEHSMVGIVTVVISVFFAIDRIINILNLLKNTIESNSIQFILDNELSDEDLIKQSLVIDDVKKVTLSEETLIKQIVIYYKLNNINQAKQLVEIYKDSGHQKQNVLIYSIDYFLKDNRKLSLDERKVILEEIGINKVNEICFLPIIEEYITVLYWLKSSYKDIIEIAEEHWLYLTEDSKYILYYSCLKNQNYEMAKNIKKEILNFNEIEMRMQYDKV